jgi:hypothetical protein
MNNKGQFSIIAALLVAIILISTVIVTYSTIRNSTIQNQPPILSAIDETNLAIKQVLGFTVGYYCSILQVTGNVSYAKMSATNYLQSGLVNIANMNPQWGTSVNLNSSALQANWFTGASYSSGNLSVRYDLTGLGIRGINYTASCKLGVQILNSTSGQACMNITQDEDYPLVTLGKQNFNFYSYNSGSSNWDLINPNVQPTSYSNGTYQVNLPSGVNSTAYVVQVKDQRGIIVVASSFNCYTVALTWNSTSVNSAQTLYAHQETTTIGGLPYYLLKNSSADASGTTLNASVASTGRQLMGKFVYNLTGIFSMPASTWTVNYRAWIDNTSSITFDSSSSGNNTDGSSSVFSWKHTTGSGANRIMTVGVGVKFTGGNEHVVSVSYGSQSLTSLRNDSSPNSIRSEIWYLVGPNTGTNNVTVTLSTSQKAAGGSVTYSGVSQTPPAFADTAGGNGTSSSSLSTGITVTTSNSFLVGHLAIRKSGSSAPTVTSEGNGQTVRWDNSSTYDSTSNNRGHGSEMGPVSGSQTMSWNLSGSADWAVSIVALKPAVQPPSVHGDIDIYVRQSNGTTRTTIATNVAPSANFTSTPTTLSGTYSWANYTVVNQTDYLEIDYYVDVVTAMSGMNAHLRIDDTALAASNQTSATNTLFAGSTIDLYSLSRRETIVVELLQNGTMRWLGQNLALTNSNSTLPFPPVPVKSIHINETINGVNGEVPFQIEDWASMYRVPLGLTSNMSIFSSRTMLVFLATPNASKVTIWWNGSDTAIQTALAYANTCFNDNPSASSTYGTLSNNMTTLQVYNPGSSGIFVVTSINGSSSCNATFMRINNDNSVYWATPAYVITNGTVRDIIHQEAEWYDGPPNCQDIYSDIVLTLPANATFYTYQISLMFVQSQQNRTISDLCPVWLSSLTGNVQTENGTSGGLPTVSNATALFYNYSASSWAHHWSQSVSGAKGAGVMFTDGANQNLYIFDNITGITTGGLEPNSTAHTIQLLPVAKSQVSFNTTLDSRMQDIIWYGAVATFDTTAPPIYDNNDQTGLWIIAEYPPTTAVTTQSY